MNSSEFATILRERLAQWASIDTVSLQYVDDQRLRYDLLKSVVAERSDLFTADDLSRWSEYLSGSHSWIHANLLTTVDGQHVISLRHGPPSARVAGADPGSYIINVSKEPTPLVIAD